MCVEIPHLRYVVAAAEHRSFRRAATALNITQPTLSKRIRELEDRLGVLLFERSTGGAYLTTEGEDFVAGARRVLAELDRMENHAKAAKVGDAGRLDIGFYTSMSGPLRETVFAFKQQHEQIDVNIIEDSRSTLIPLLDRGVIDIAVVLGEPSYQDYAHLSLWSERIMVAFPKAHRLAERNFVYWTDLKNERVLMSQRDPGPEIHDILLSKLTAPGERPFIKHVKAHHSVLVSTVDGDRGITLACESSSIPPWPGVVFREVRDGNGPTRLGFVAYWRRNNESPALKQFLAWLQAHPVVPLAAATTDDANALNRRESRPEG
jgi:DNA-binding transcriptional LysR family regulator